MLKSYKTCRKTRRGAVWLCESTTAPLCPTAAIPPHPALLQARRHNPRLPLKSPRKITLIIEPQLRRHAGDALPALEELRRRYGPQTASRIEGEYQILPFFGEDIRKLRKERQ